MRINICLVVIFCLIISSILAKNDSKVFNKSLFDFLFSPCKCRCGVPNREGKILGGEATFQHEFPWSATIHINGKSHVPGTIINNKYIITAASVVKGLDPYDVKITVGHFDKCYPEHSLSNNMSVEKILIHPDFSMESKNHDIALLKINSLISFDHNISPICLSTPSTKYLGHVSTVFGWPEDEENQTVETLLMSCKQRKLGLPILGNRECTVPSKEIVNLNYNLGCIGVIGISSPLGQQDSGGAVMFRTYNGVYELVGILTYLNAEARKSGLAFYTSINDHLGWITQNSKDACFCFKT